LICRKAAVDGYFISPRYRNVTKKADGSLEIPYQKNGAAPEFYIRDENYVVLNSKTDYSVQLKDNKKITADSGQDMTCTIRGKGNYNGYEKTVTLTVTKADIGKALITVPDKQHDIRPDKWKAGVTVTDTNGKKLAAKTDYLREIAYSYPDMNPADPTAVPSIGTTVTVTVTGTGFYEGTLTGTYRIYDKAKDIGKLKIAIDPQTYTGEEIKLQKEDIHVYASAADQNAKKELADKDSCIEIVESTYKNNIKVGTAKINLHGIGDYGGTKTYSFKIQKKAYGINRVKAIKLDKTSHTFSLASNETERKLTATITPQTPEQPLANPTVIWTSSNTKIATVEPVKTDTENNPQNTLTSSVIIQAKTKGTVTITALTQDGNKKATCRITINIPTLTQANRTITGKVGDTYQLTLDGNEDQEILADGITFESDNQNVVSVSDRGLLSMKKMGAATIKAYIGSKDNVQQCYVIVEGEVTEPEQDSRVIVYHQESGCTDDTPKINQLLRNWEWNPNKYDYMYIPEGIYHIDAVSEFGGIVLTDNQTLIMSPEAQLFAIGNNQENSQIIWAFGRNNVVISGGKLVGERNSHIGNRGEWGHGIRISGCTNVYIKDVEISECWGDGIYLGKYDNTQLGNPSSNGVTITNCNLHHNRRNNLSITDASNVTVSNSQFNNASGTDPQYGIDIEPNKNRTCSNVTISNCTFKGNAKGTIQILGQLNAHVKGVTIENCIGDKAPVIWSGFGGSVSGVEQSGNKWN
ncbi:MAG: Ig-like domain-containing protein, partial [Lachnospiraceae bacterium]|nr:Ig-like domain-containing protein [Lachnospiraceae bacterium]